MQEAIELLQKVGKQQLGLENEPLKVEKVAVWVKNEREFKILMRHYYDIGYKWDGGEPALPITDLTRNQLAATNFNTAIMYMDGFLFNPADPGQWNIIDFDFFCAQKGIANSKPILTTEDGVDIYDKSRLIFTVKKHCDGWYHNGYNHANTTLANKPEYFKFFYSKEAAEKWIEEQKPKEIRLYENSEIPIIVKKDKILFDHCSTKYIQITGSELEEIYAAFKSLQ